MNAVTSSMPRAAVGTLATARSQAFDRLALPLSVVSALILVGLCVAFARAPREDFATYYAAGLSARSAGADLYTLAIAWRDAGSTVNSPAPAPAEGTPFVYPPVFALAFAPLTLLTLAQASLVWYVLTFASVVASVWLLGRMLLPAS